MMNHRRLVEVLPPMSFGDLEINLNTGILAGTNVRQSPISTDSRVLHDPIVLMIHFTQGVGTASDTITEMKNAGKGSHIVIDRSGGIWQCVPFNRVAKHAGLGQWRGFANSMNEHSIGIELCNLGPLWLTEDNRFVDSYGIVRTDRDTMPAPHRNARAADLKVMWKSSPLPDDRARYANIVKQGISEEKLNLFCWWEIYPEEQQRALQRLCSILVTRYPAIRDIIGHDDYAPTRRLDPGPALQLQKVLGWMPEGRTFIYDDDPRRGGYTGTLESPDYLRNLVTSRTFAAGNIGRDIW